MPVKDTSPRTPAPVASPQADSAYREEMDKLKNDIGKLQSDVSELVDILRATATSKSSEIKDKVGDEAEHVFEELINKLGEGIDKGKRSVDEVSERIGEHPVGTLFISFSLGYILAKIMERGGSSGKPG